MGKNSAETRCFDEMRPGPCYHIAHLLLYLYILKFMVWEHSNKE
jgi:hypothetical protein